MNQQQQANLIKVAAVVTATPRWVGSLLAAEGLTIPTSWQSWWLPVSALLSAGMALVEGLAFAYVFNAWRTQKDKAANKLLWLAILSAVVFVMVLAPFIAAQVRQVALDVVLGTGWALWVWSASVAASTIVIVASTGYAQKQKDDAQAPATTKKVAPEPEPITPELQQPAAKIGDWRALYEQTNGEYAQVNGEGVRVALEAKGFTVTRAPRTLDLWAAEAREKSE